MALPPRQYKELYGILKDSETVRKDIILELYSKGLISENEYEQIIEKERKKTSDEVVQDLLKMIRAIFKSAPEKSEEVLEIMGKEMLLKNAVQNIRKRKESFENSDMPSKKSRIDDCELSSEPMIGITEGITHSQGIHFYTTTLACY